MRFVPMQKNNIKRSAHTVPGDTCVRPSANLDNKLNSTSAWEQELEQELWLMR